MKKAKQSKYTLTYIVFRWYDKVYFSIYDHGECDLKLYLLLLVNENHLRTML